MKGAPIKPGTLRIVIHDPVNAGVFVTAARRVPELDERAGGIVWAITKPSRPVYYRGEQLHEGDMYALAQHLVPISDPDADITEINEEELTT